MDLASLQGLFKVLSSRNNDCVAAGEPRQTRGVVEGLQLLQNPRTKLPEGGDKRNLACASGASMLHLEPMAAMAAMLDFVPPTCKLRSFI